MSAQRRPSRGTAGRGAAHSAASTVSRVGRAWRVLEREQRRAALASVALFLTMFLPWYSKNFTGVGTSKGQAVEINTTTHLNAFQAFSWVEGAVLLVSFGVLYLLFARAERRAFHLPGGDGTVIMLAGAWTGLLIFYRFFDKQTGNDRIRVTFGVTWGIFVALLAAIFLTYAGTRIRAAGRPEPPLMLDHHEPPDAGDEEGPAGDPPGAADRVQARRSRASSGRPAHAAEPADPVRPRYPPAPTDDEPRERPSRIVTREDAAQLSFENPTVEDPFGGEPPTRRRRRR